MAKRRGRKKNTSSGDTLSQLQILENYRKQVDELKGELKEEIRKEIKSDLARQIASEVASELRGTPAAYGAVPQGIQGQSVQDPSQAGGTVGLGASSAAGPVIVPPGTLAEQFLIADFPPRISEVDFHIPEEDPEESAGEYFEKAERRKKAVRFADEFVDRCVAVILVAALLFGLYSMYDSNQVYSAADASNYTAFRPTSDNSPGFAQLREQNPEVIGWLTVNDTPIDYPVAQAVDNDYYIDHTVEGEYRLSGAVFLDYRNSCDFSDFNSIIYGHHMEQEKMFGSLSNFGDQEYFAAHRYGTLYFREDWSGYAPIHPETEAVTEAETEPEPEVVHGYDIAPSTSPDALPRETEGESDASPQTERSTLTGSAGSIGSVVAGAAALENVTQTSQGAQEAPREGTSVGSNEARVASEGPDASLSSDFKLHGIEWFAVILTDAYNFDLINPAIQGREEQKAYLERLIANAKYSRDVELSPDDTYIMLYTCTTELTNGRYLLVGRLIDEVHLSEAREAPVRLGTGVDRLVDLPPLMIWAALIITIPLHRLLRRMRRRRRERYIQYRKEKARWDRYVAFIERQSDEYVKEMLRRYRPRV